MAFGVAAETIPNAAINASVDARGAFIIKTYVHLVAAIFAFVAIETVIFALGIDELFLGMVYGAIGNGRVVWGIVLVLFIASGYAAQKLANQDNPTLAYAGLGIEVLSWSVVFIWPLYFAVHYSSPDVLPTAAITTLVVFGGLTGIVFITRKDFSFLKGILGVGALVALAVIVCSLIFGFQLGIFFMGAMVLLASGYVLFYTSNVLHHYRTDQHVAASLALFSSLALLFWYILQLFMSRR